MYKKYPNKKYRRGYKGTTGYYGGSGQGMLSGGGHNYGGGILTGGLLESKNFIGGGLAKKISKSK